jgi:hypothetical protein
MRKVCVAALVVLAFGCEKKPAAVAPPVVEAKAAPVAESKAEVEFTGDWSRNGVTAEKVIFVAQLEPCLPVPAAPTRLGEEVMQREGPVFAEFFIPQGTVGHACLYGLNAAGAVVAAASYEKNPLTWKGVGEVVVGPMKFALAPVK